MKAAGDTLQRIEESITFVPSISQALRACLKIRNTCCFDIEVIRMFGHTLIAKLTAGTVKGFE